MELLYNLGIFLFSLVVKTISPISSKAKLLYQGRKKAFDLIKSGTLPTNAVWVHCASLGEFEQGRPIIELIKTQFPDEKIIVTFFSPSGYEIRKNYNNADSIFYLPADTKANATLLVSKLKPKMAIFIKYEFWHHYINQLSASNTPIYLASAIFRKDQIFFKAYGQWFRKILQRVSFFYCQDQNSVNLLRSIGIEKCNISGDTRFDRVYEIAKSVKTIPHIDIFKANKQVLIAGSSWLPDEEIFIKYIQKHPDLKLIIAPHEIDNLHIEKIKSLLKSNYSIYTEQNITTWHDSQVLIIDTIGLLSSLYQYGDVAYIGGGFGKGIHNTLEAATFGLPIFFGPKYKKFKEANDLICLNAAFAISTYEEFESKVDKLLNNKEVFATASSASKNYVQSQIGATEKILGAIFK